MDLITNCKGGDEINGVRIKEVGNKTGAVGFFFADEILFIYI